MQGSLFAKTLSDNGFKVVSRVVEIEKAEVLKGPLSFKIRKMNLLWDKE